MLGIYFELYLVFFIIGATAFGGGYAVLPLIQQYVVEERAWMNMTEFVDLVSISQMTPGPIAINSATFVGNKIGGIGGSIVATLGCISPQMILMLVLGYFLFVRKRKFLFLNKMLMALRPGVVGLIFIAALSMAKSSLFPQTISLGGIEPVAGLCFILGAFLYLKKLDMIKIIGLGALGGLVLTFGLGL
ncbi:MAG: chromate transporter [Tissierellia bacterium]|nr:chromate transporter [Tissierellia bacterium]